MARQAGTGRSSSATVHVPKGAGCLGIDWADVDRKYRTLMPAASLDGARIEQSLGLMHTFELLVHVSTLLAALATPTHGETA